MAASKKKSNAVQKDCRHVKYVPAAGMWCTTVVVGGQQSQTWTLEKP